MILVLAGTKDGREIAKKLSEKGLKVIATAVTEYGASLLEKGIEVLKGPLDEKGFIELIKNRGIEIVINATHPFAKEVSLNAINASVKMGSKYIRFERQNVDYKNAFVVKSFEEAAKACEKYDSIFLTIGSKNLEKFKYLWEAGKKVTVRVLPLSSVIKKCEELGLTPKDIIAMEGPFSVDLNYQMFKEKRAEVVVTKESGYVGGVLEKLEAAEMLGIPVILIERPSINYPVIIRDEEALIDVILRAGDV
ncbi:hypothetical protein O163_13960 [Caldanaerobacter subterraneus subsp. yonseiensis KB-1]|uniref:Uncharacterized protein n=1 Tax=Caldanaerobacter subterraneus subsp. yonseiensis KB-1 TaxID=1388761 RepID=U5CPB6_CALSX|nr:precorrin-6A reductase [Caldanaerobacter subterraneus]ERM90791.1 hypothetical protein O163_13960 [Caldanaerobacter subterraneus subsp. yonseiensis KB-1]